MRSDWKNLSSAIVEQVISIEAINMIPVLAEVGINLSKEIIRSEIEKDPNQIVIFSLESKIVKSFIRYSAETDKIYIKSIQLNPAVSRYSAFTSILNEASQMLNRGNLTLVESIVQRSNFKSLQLHKKLGFKPTRENEKAIQFNIASNELASRINKLLRKKFLTLACNEAPALQT